MHAVWDEKWHSRNGDKIQQKRGKEIHDLLGTGGAQRETQVFLFSFCLSNTQSFCLFVCFLILFLFLAVLIFVSVRGLSLVAASGGHSSSRCTGLSLSRPLLLRITGSRRAGSVIVAQGPSCSAACGIFPDQGSNPCPLHWQADSQPLRHQGSPPSFSYKLYKQFPMSVECLQGAAKDKAGIVNLEALSC